MKYFIAILSLFCVALTSCGKKDSSEEKPTILVSVPPYVYFVEKIAGFNHFHVRSLVPGGADPHTYEPSPKEVEAAQNAVLWIKLGEAFDHKVQKVFEERSQKIKIVNITDGLDLLSYCTHGDLVTEGHQCSHSHHEGFDLHVWLSLRMGKIQAKNIANALIEMFPEHTKHFERNLDTLLKELDVYDNEISQILSTMEGRTILASHPAFAYFCRDYGMIQLSIETKGKEPLPQDVTKVLKQIKDYNVKCIILEPQANNKGAELIAHSLRLPTHMIDPLAEHVPDNMLTLAKLLID